ncbi:hypothetical protein C6T60_14465 [Burkholderia multivorans]|uniref:hypothetical protein n=1 Tax=Burkholderia multivorans TaxID=87883 RepID=UPI000CFEB8E2|nr:hypothetical protein [Burkholderia multivorans]PRH05458.1 hypothetical protein C6T60_14465 [Burkholderia multivorans]
MLNPQLTERAADFWSDRQLQQFNDAADAEEAAFERASAEVQIADVINAMAELPDGFLAKVMNAFLDKGDHAHFVYLLEILFEDAFNAAAEGIAKRKGY